VVCDDGEGCTSDSCDPATGCVFEAVGDGLDCDDGDLCTSGDTCVAGECASNNETPCDDGNPCTDDGCDSEAGCFFVPVRGLPCEDGSVCTVGDTCVQGACVGDALLCDDGEQCTFDYCHPLQGCMSAAKEEGAWCDDGDVCTLFDNCCGTGVCGGLDLVDCNDGNACTDDVCDPLAGCLHTMADDSVPCADGDTCTSGTCDAGSCVGDGFDCSDGNPCTVDFCHPAEGCLHPSAPEGWPCSDGDACTGVDQCEAGACTPGAPVDCEDGQPCTIDFCDPIFGCKALPHVEPETCDGLDNDCDGQIDEGCATLSGTVCFDLDQDGTQGAGEGGLEGETILVSGSCAGEPFLLEAVTDADGGYVVTLDPSSCPESGALVELASAIPFVSTSPNPIDVQLTSSGTTVVDFCLVRDLVHCATGDWLASSCATLELLPISVGGATFATIAEVEAALQAGPFSPPAAQLTSALLTAKLNIAAYGIGPLPWDDIDGDDEAETLAEIVVAAEAALVAGDASMWSYLVVFQWMEAAANCVLDASCQ
jgi:hypothetical protein